MIAIRIICKTINPPAKGQTGIFNLFIETPPQQIYECNGVAEENAMRNHSRLLCTDTHSGRMINRQGAHRRRLLPASLSAVSGAPHNATVRSRMLSAGALL